MRTLALTVLMTLMLAACVDRPGGGGATVTPGGTVPAAQGDWHATDSLFRLMGGVQGKVVADLFIGDGYYTLKLLEAGAKVIAMDDDPGNVEALAAKARELGIGEDRLVIRTAVAGSPNLALNEVDAALCTRQFTSIPDRTEYFRKVKASIKSPSPLFIVDFLPEQTPVGPPVEQRVSELQVMDAMEPVGFTDIGGYTRKLPYRFVVHAMDFIEGSPMDGPPVTVQAPL